MNRRLLQPRSSPERTALGRSGATVCCVVALLWCLAIAACSDGGPDGAGGPSQDPAQRFQSLRFGAFLHFNMGTFTGKEWADPNGDPARFDPDALDTDQWAAAAAAAGMKYMVLTTKHHDGFCLWDSDSTSYDVASSPLKGRDVVREYADSARSHALAVGIYYSIWDRTGGDARGTPAVDLVKSQLRELLTRYGPISVLWFDGWGWLVGYERLPYEEIREYIRSIQPDVLVLENNHEFDLEHTDIIGYERNVDSFPSAASVAPTEVADNVRADGKWFFSDGACNLKPAEELLASLHAAAAVGANYLLDVTPDVHGRIPDCQVRLLAEIGRGQ